MQNPRITVLMPVYNAGKFLGQSIESVLAQTFTDFEFLILDDGSTDNSVDIINSYTDPRIRFYRNEQNLGISATLNKGIALAGSELIARMDADDICYPERLQKQYSYLSTHSDCAMVSSLVRVVSEERQLLRLDDFKSAYFYYNLTFECWIYHPSIMFRRQAVQEVGGYTIPYSEDFELFWQLSRNHKIHNLPEILLDYRVSSQSLHQVQKKTEYDNAQHEQVLRNLRYFAGPNFNIPATYVECLRHNFMPLLKEGKVQHILNCLQVLDEISKKILTTPNLNRVPEAITEAYFYKRAFIISWFIKNLPLHKSLYLAFRTNSLKLITRKVKNQLKRMVGR